MFHSNRQSDKLLYLSEELAIVCELDKESEDSLLDVSFRVDRLIEHALLESLHELIVKISHSLNKSMDLFRIREALVERTQDFLAQLAPLTFDRL